VSRLNRQRGKSEIRLTIFTELPSANKVMRMHWAERKRLRIRLAAEIGCAYMDQSDKPIHRRQIKRSVIVKLYRRGRRFDKDNAYGAAKILIDSLRDLGLIYNDSEKWLDLSVCQELDHENPRTVIEIKDFKAILEGE